MGFSNERMRTGQLVNWFLLDGLEMTPAGNPITKALPLPFGVDHLIGFNELLTCKHPESAGVHFFLDDYQFERFWRQPERYLNALAEYMDLKPRTIKTRLKDDGRFWIDGENVGRKEPGSSG